MKSLKSKLIITYSVALVLFLTFLLLYINRSINDTFTLFLKSELQQNNEYINTYCLSFNKPINRELFASKDIIYALNDLAKKSLLRITIIQQDGSIIFDSSANPKTMGNRLYRPEMLQAAKYGFGMDIRKSQTVNEEMLYVASFYDYYYIRTAKPLSTINLFIDSLTKNILIAGIVVIAGTIILNFIFASAFTRPIKESLGFIQKFFDGNLNTRILNYKDDEMGYLQKSMNQLADNIEQRINELTYEKNKLFMIIESIHDVIALIDEHQKITVFNKAFTDLFEYPETVRNKYYFTVIRNSHLNAKIHYAISQRQKISFEETIGGNNFQAFILPFVQPSRGILLLLHDVTEQKRIQQLKAELVGNLSHELKTPISIIRGYLETIHDNICDEKTARHFISNALINVDRQNAIINDMLKLNELETSTYQLSEAVNVGIIIAQCIDLLALKIQKKNVAIVLSIDSIPESLYGNAFLAEEIFFNIIDNAINYNNPGGSITIQSTDDPHHVGITITDTGIGIPHDEINRIFERFYRIDKSRSRETGGTGLGLSIVKHATQLLGWKVAVTSSMKGSTFTVIIPKIKISS